MIRAVLRFLRSTPLHPVKVPVRAKFQTDDRLESRIAEARKRLPANSIKALRRELEVAVRDGKPEARELTARVVQLMRKQ